MSNTLTIRDYLFEELGLAVRTTKNLIAKVEDNEWSYRPKDNMRTLQELTHHLVSIPLADLACLIQEKGQGEYASIEKNISEVKDPAQLGSIMEDNFNQLREYINRMSEEEAMTKVTKPFYYEEGGNVQIRWLMEIVTHTFHHRAQLFNYLKQLEHDINMYDLY